MLELYIARCFCRFEARKGGCGPTNKSSMCVCGGYVVRILKKEAKQE
jgi:hypothetical protein